MDDIGIEQRIGKRTVLIGLTAVTLVGLLTLSVALGLKSTLFPEAPTPTGHSHISNASGGFFRNFLKVYTPRRVCMFEEPGVIWLHFISDFLITVAYFSIPITLIYFVRKREDLKFSWMFCMFAAFILLCGTTHAFGMWALWQPVYRLDGAVKLLTGLVSIATAVALWPLIPKALKIPSTAMLEKRVVERTAELERAKEERELALQRLKIAQSASAIVSWEWDIQSGKMTWQGDGEQVYGFPIDEHYDRERFRERIFHDDRDLVDAAVQQALSGKGPLRTEYRYVWPDRSVHWLLAEGKVFFGENRQPSRIIGIHKEITDRKVQEQELKEALERLKILNERIQTSMVETHHRIKNSLNTVSSLLLSKVAGKTDVPAAEIKRTVRHIHKLARVHDILTIQAKNYTGEQTTSTDAALQDLISVLQYTFNGKLSADIERVGMTPEKVSALAIILNEAVSNSQKHGATAVTITLKRDNEYVNFEVRDNGPGLPENLAERITAGTGLDIIKKVSESDLKTTPEIADAVPEGVKLSLCIPLSDTELKAIGERKVEMSAA